MTPERRVSRAERRSARLKALQSAGMDSPGTFTQVRPLLDAPPKEQQAEEEEAPRVSLQTHSQQPDTPKITELPPLRDEEEDSFERHEIEAGTLVADCMTDGRQTVMEANDESIVTVVRETEMEKPTEAEGETLMTSMTPMTPLTKMKLTEADLCTPEATKVEVDQDFLVLEHSASRVEMFETDMYEDTDKEEEKKESFRPSPMKLPSAQPKSASAASRK